MSAPEQAPERFVILSGADAVGMPAAPVLTIGDLAAFSQSTPPSQRRATYRGGRSTPAEPRHTWPLPIELYAPRYVDEKMLDAFARALAKSLGFL